MKKIPVCLLRLRFVLTRLWRYQQLYFLKPHDAINDTLTSSLLYRLDWTGPVVEIGSGDGVFSYIMHGGVFPTRYDRYLATNLKKIDIYDTHTPNLINPTRVLEKPNVIESIDAKLSHVKKVYEIGFSQAACYAAYENLPLRSKSISKIFYYTPHNLQNHDRAIQEAHRVLAPDGRMLILLYDDHVESGFLCHRLSKALTGRLGEFFCKLDNGRHDEICTLARSYEEWVCFFSENGFEIERSESGLSKVAWMAYDVQTRPFLKPLIKLFSCFPHPWRTIAKQVWRVCWYPYLVLFYLLFSNQYLRISGKDCYIAFQVKKVNN